MNYLNTVEHHDLFQMTLNSPNYVDKSLLIQELNTLILTNGRFICITRPRRFGKSVNANMIASYYGVKVDSRKQFDNLFISKTKDYEKHLNKHNVIFINFSNLKRNVKTYDAYIEFIENSLLVDLIDNYPSTTFNKEEPLWRLFSQTNEKFIFVLDEWDYVFSDSTFSENERNEFLFFLKDLLKDRSYAELVYMTGVLPIANYSSGSALNMFDEYNFINDRIYDSFFGFTETEVKELCSNSSLNYREIEEWYNGYVNARGNKIFNPKSVYLALKNGYCDSYWTSTGRFDEISYYTQHNVEAVREDIVQMAANIPLDIELKGYGAEMLKIDTRDRILSAMVIYGFLSYHDHYLKIPNKELMKKFNEALCDKSMGYVYTLAMKSDAMLKATLNGDTKIMEGILDFAHDTEVPILKYNDENSLACLLTLVYLNARSKYRIEREDASGKGYADFIFYPNQNGEPAIILELKKDKGAISAIEQIKEKRYYTKLKNITGKIIAVGISYNNDKDHECIVEDITSFKDK